MKKTIKRRTALTEIAHENSVLQRVYANRGVQSKEELERNLESLLPFNTLMGIEKAVILLFDALSQQKKLLIIGDFDADGATSTAVAIRALKSFGAQSVNYLVPNRFEFGYGLTPELVEVASQEFAPDMIITVDNGIANHAGVLRAKELGIQVLITDHHLPAETLPLADAIVNPNQFHDVFPSKSIAGVGVIFYVMLALRRYLSDNGWFEKQSIPEPTMSRLLDLVALGTVADVVSLDQNNRIMVYQGLRRIRAGQCISGITALLQVAKRNQALISSSDLGFSVAPRLNAAGRLDDMSLGIECLITDDLTHALHIAATLSELNDERRVIENEMKTQAMTILNSVLQNKQSLPLGICLFDETWHQGVIGILASRVKEHFHRPVIAFAMGNDTEIKGSARSISGLHIRDVLADIDVKNPNLIKKFGGHAMAAGLTLDKSNYPEFSRLFNELVSEKLGANHEGHVFLSDGELTQSELALDIAELLREAGPWGQSFPEPVFDGIFKIVDQHLVAGKHLKLNLQKEEQLFEAIAFNVDLKLWPNYRAQAVNLVYRLDVNEFRNKKKLQLIAEYLEVSEGNY